MIDITEYDPISDEAQDKETYIASIAERLMKNEDVGAGGNLFSLMIYGFDDVVEQMNADKLNNGLLKLVNGEKNSLHDDLREAAHVLATIIFDAVVAYEKEH